MEMRPSRLTGRGRTELEGSSFLLGLLYCHLVAACTFAEAGEPQAGPPCGGADHAGEERRVGSSAPGADVAAKSRETRADECQEFPEFPRSPRRQGSGFHKKPREGGK